MSDLMINQAALLSRMRERLNDLRSEYGRFDHYLNGFSDAVFMVGRSQSIEAEPVRHGRWVARKEIFDGEQEQVDAIGCSLCGKSQRALRRTPYCPNCGAKMDLEA